MDCIDFESSSEKISHTCSIVYKLGLIIHSGHFSVVQIITHHVSKAILSDSAKDTNNADVKMYKWRSTMGNSTDSMIHGQFFTQSIRVAFI